MFKFIRKKNIAKSIFLILAVGILISTFIFWGSKSNFGELKNQTIGIIFGKKISSQEFFKNYKTTYILLQLRYENFEEIKELLNFNAYTWERLIILEAVKREKIKINDTELINYIQNIGLFQSKDGFSLKLYEVITKNLGLSKREFEEMMRQQLIIDDFYKRMTKNVYLKEEEAAAEYKKSNESVTLEIITIPTSNFENIIEVSLEEAKQYYQTKSEDFKEPDKVNLNFIGVDYIEETTNEIKQNARDKISQVHQKLIKTKDFAKIANEYFLEIKETGFFSANEPITQFGWLPELTQKAFSLKEGTFLGPLETERGCFILKLKEFKPSYIPAFEETKDKVIQTLKKKKAQESAKQEAIKYRQEITERLNKNPNLDLEKWAQNLNLKYTKKEDFKRNDYLPGLGFSVETENLVFDLSKEGFSEAIAGPNGFYLLRRVGFKPIEEDKFKEEKEEFSAQLLQQKKDFEFNKYVREKLKPQTSLFVDLYKDKSPMTDF